MTRVIRDGRACGPAELGIRPALAGDADAIVAFNRAMALETEGRTLPEPVVGPGVRRVFDEPDHGFYLVAECDRTIVGALMITYEWSDWRNGRFWWIQSVYVQPGWRGRGVYRALYDEVRARARAAGDVCGFRLYVDKENRAAQLAYRSLGMAESGYLIYEEMIER